MSESNHTPLPWTFNGHTCYGASQIPTERRANGEFIPPLRPIVFAVTEASIKAADRALIEAAPYLLEALSELAEIGEGGVIERRETGQPTWHALDAVRTIARAAIAKATETP